MTYDNRPVGVFDSGVGGISVLKELVATMPNEKFIYFGDSANAPYGTKSDEEVQRLSIQCTEFLLQMDCKCIVIACNTATAASVSLLRNRYPNIPVIGIEPALKPAVTHCPNGQVIVMATNVTLHEPKFLHLLNQFKDAAEIITVPCPDIVQYVEKGENNSPELVNYLDKQIGKYRNSADAVVLGCTHYPFVSDGIRQILGDAVYIVHGGDGTARETLRQLKLHSLCADVDSKGSVSIYNSKPDMIELSKKLLVK